MYLSLFLVSSHPQICNKVHPVLKILLFQHHAGPQALIQFGSPEEAAPPDGAVSCGEAPKARRKNGCGGRGRT